MPKTTRRSPRVRPAPPAAPSPTGVPEAVWAILLEEARRARAAAYAPYSRFKVGAALLGEDGGVYAGCNVENASLGLTICAERNAVAAAVAAGTRRFLALALCAGADIPASPCGACRQVLAEFGPDLPLRMTSDRGAVVETRLAQLLPLHFSLADLKRRSAAPARPPKR